MRKLLLPIGATSLVLFIYLISVFSNVVFNVVFLLFILLNILTVWMVIRILKDGKPSGQTFDDQWYEDA